MDGDQRKEVAQLTILTASEYEKRKFEFLKRHGNWEVETSPMDEYGMYYKWYHCEDGALFHEIMRPVFKKAEVEICKVKVEVEVKFLETEAWDSDVSQSVYYYERF